MAPDTIPPGTTVIEPPPAEPTDYTPEKETGE
jgi:hypothetical protein